jgi:hypothetical protein
VRKSKTANLLRQIALTMTATGIPSRKYGIGSSFTAADLWENRNIIPDRPWSSVSKVTDPKTGCSMIRCQLQRHSRGFKHYKGPELFQGEYRKNRWTAINEVDPIRAGQNATVAS